MANDWGTRKVKLHVVCVAILPIEKMNEQSR